jgi:hypothetical protein
MDLCGPVTEVRRRLQARDGASSYLRVPLDGAVFEVCLAHWGAVWVRDDRRCPVPGQDRPAASGPAFWDLVTGPREPAPAVQLGLAL